MRRGMIDSNMRRDGSVCEASDVVADFWSIH
jgi:hypothetical protein